MRTFTPRWSDYPTDPTDHFVSGIYKSEALLAEAFANGHAEEVTRLYRHADITIRLSAAWAARVQPLHQRYAHDDQDWNDRQ